MVIQKQMNVLYIYTLQLILASTSMAWLMKSAFSVSVINLSISQKVYTSRVKNSQLHPVVTMHPAIMTPFCGIWEGIALFEFVHLCCVLCKQ